MSVRIMAQVWDRAKTEGNALLVLLALADFADDTGWCWPSMATIARKARVSERGARGIIRRLETDGLLISEQSKGRTSSRYRVIVNPEAVAGFDPINTEAVAGSNPEAVAGSNSLNPEDSDTQPGSPLPPNHQEPPIKKKEKKDSCAFLEFWNCYPRRLGKKAAAAKFSAAVKSGISSQHLIQAAASYADHCRENRIEERFIKHPTTWLHQGCWDDELKPERTSGNDRTTRTDTLMRLADGIDQRTGADQKVDHGAGSGDASSFLPARIVG